MNPEDILREMASTFEKRGAIYGDNWEKIGSVMRALFPDGFNCSTEYEHNVYHLFMMIMVKITRLAATNLYHIDSAHDIGVYAAMLETLIRKEKRA